MELKRSNLKCIDVGREFEHNLIEGLQLSELNRHLHRGVNQFILTNKELLIISGVQQVPRGGRDN
jgi:hypothetical protein